MSEGGSMELNLQRVKVYRLNDDGKWDDKGTGHVSVEYLERSNAVGLVVIDEDDSATLLVHRISADDIYQRQEDTIISWTDPEIATDLALSFQETMGCNYIWDQIFKVQCQMQYPPPNSHEVNPQQIEDYENGMASADVDEGDLSSILSDFLSAEDSLPDNAKPAERSALPAVEFSNLPQIEKLITEATHFQRDRVATMVLREQGYVSRILELFRECEDLENWEGLHHLYRIVRGLIMLNDGTLLDVLFAEDAVLDVIGALEYDPEGPSKQEYRKYLENEVKYKQAIPIPDPVILSKVHQTYQIGYIKDVILPRALDDQTLSTLNSLIIFNNIEIVSGLHGNQPFMADFFSSMLQRDPAEPSWSNSILFLREFCTLHKHLPPSQRIAFLREMTSSGVFDIVTIVLQQADEKVKQCGMDILMSTVGTDPGRLRNFLVEQKEFTLFSLMVKKLLLKSEVSLHAQLLDLLRLLLDSENVGSDEKDRFLEAFYDRFIDLLVGGLVGGCPGPPSSPPCPYDTPADILSNVCELLCFCVKHHSFRIKYYILRNNVVEKVLRMTRRREKYLQVAAIRFLRTCIGLKDEFYLRYIVKNNLFDPIVQLFVANKNRYNLLYSAVLEMTDFIRKENLKLLIGHLVERHWSAFEHVDRVDTFTNLMLKYEQGKEGPSKDSSPSPSPSGPSPAGASKVHVIGPARRRKDERDLDGDEESYFSEDGEEENRSPVDASQKQGWKLLGTSPVPPPANGKAVVNQEAFRKAPLGLVDYEDEEDSEGMNGSGSSTSAKSPLKRRRLDMSAAIPPAQQGEEEEEEEGGAGGMDLVPRRKRPEEDGGEEDWFSGKMDSFGGSFRRRNLAGEKRRKVGPVVKILVSRKEREGRQAVGQVKEEGEVKEVKGVNEDQGEPMQEEGAFAGSGNLGVVMEMGE